MGVFAVKMASATRSVLNAWRFESLPPPRPTIIASTSSEWSRWWMPFAMDVGAFDP